MAHFQLHSAISEKRRIYVTSLTLSLAIVFFYPVGLVNKRLLKRSDRPHSILYSYFTQLNSIISSDNHYSCAQWLRLKLQNTQKLSSSRRNEYLFTLSLSYRSARRSTLWVVLKISFFPLVPVLFSFFSCVF